MALAIRFEKLVCDNAVENYSQLTELGYVSRARITQLMNLLLRAPDIQEDILFLPKVYKGKYTLRERNLRHIVNVISWTKQRKLWAKLKGKIAESNRI